MHRPSTDTILRTIWSRSTGKHVFLPSIIEGKWREGPQYEPHIVPETVWTDTSYDHYFTPLRYRDKRSRETVGRPGVIFADLDSPSSIDEMQRLGLEPSVLIQSSPGHSHGYWFLKEPASLLEWESRARGWSHAIKADPGGWDATQVLRVPGTWNRKPGKNNRVEVIHWNPAMTYRLDMFPEREGYYAGPSAYDAPLPLLAVRTEVLDYARKHSLLPLSVLYFLEMDKDSLKASGIYDRSTFMWKLYHEMLDHGMEPTHIFHVVHFAVWNKHRDNPNRLWREINKAKETR